MRCCWFVSASLGLVLLLHGVVLQAAWRQYSDHAMGTLINVEMWHDNADIAAACAQQVLDEMHRIDAAMSPYRQDSELSRVNRGAAIAAVDVSEELYQLLQRALEFSRLSAGVFDITFASVGHQFDYRERKQPSSEQISQQLSNIDYRLVQLARQSVSFARPGVRIDLGGIAKGHAVDRGVAILQRCGVEQAIVSAGGDSRILGDRRGRPWMMGIQHPRDRQQLALAIPLTDSAISTSGDYERFFLHNGERIHHILNPKTGRSASSSWSASVIGPDATATDALSTTLFVLGAEKGISLINSIDNMDAIIIDSQGVVHYSDGLAPPPGKKSPTDDTQH